MKIERRQFRRYKIPQEAIFVFDHLSARVGWIKDLSEGGVSFEYIHKAGDIVIPEVIDICSYEHDLCYLPSILCKLVYVSGSVKDPRNPAIPEAKRCGLQFRGLSNEQQKNLRSLLNIFSDKSAPQNG